jgi:gas vesicle protein
MTTRQNTGNFILGTLVGGIIGSLAALLMAPQSGEKTQKLILEKGESWRQDAVERIDDGRQYAEDKINDARNTISDWFSSGSSLLDEKSREISVEKAKNSRKEKQSSPA